MNQIKLTCPLSLKLCNPGFELNQVTEGGKRKGLNMTFHWSDRDRSDLLCVYYEKLTHHVRPSSFLHFTCQQSEEMPHEIEKCEVIRLRHLFISTICCGLS